MAGPKQIWPGPAMRRFFAAVLARETALPEPERERLADALAKPIGRLLVYHDPADLPAAKHAPVSAASPAVAGVPDPPIQSAQQGAATPAAAPFDPFAFSVIALLKRSGPEALLHRLDEISEPADLRRLAEAQHLAVAADAVSADELRHAIVTGAASRLADRRAAAS